LGNDLLERAIVVAFPRKRSIEPSVTKLLASSSACFGPSAYRISILNLAHHRIPMLYIVNNNRAYHQERMYLQAMAARRCRGFANTAIGTTITDPDVDFATVARGFGVHGEGPIADPNELGPALRRAIAMVKAGQSALVDVVTEPR
jgi:thiamine pyrophosphate-dependent acetolactate synthase large subunit-like protein